VPAPGRTPLVSQPAVEDGQECDVRACPDCEGGALTRVVGQPTERDAGQCRMGRIEKRHQPTLKIPAAHQRLLGGALGCRVIQRRSLSMNDQVPAGPEDGKVGRQHGSRRCERSQYRERKANRKADVDGDESASTNPGEGGTSHRFFVDSQMPDLI